MVRHISVWWLALLVSLLFVGGQVAADERPGKHKHDDKAPQGKTAGEHGHTTEGHTHQHPWWETPPAEYANARSTRWDDAAAIARGQQLFQTYCLMCHGADGKGTGPVAKGLPHAPADLTHHFHRAPGDGDAYLFWRVSEGGQVEPFKSSQSAMPAYKTVLSEDQRWDVLAYVHAEFHKGFLPASATTSAAIRHRRGHGHCGGARQPATRGGARGDSRLYGGDDHGIQSRTPVAPRHAQGGRHVSALPSTRSRRPLSRLRS